MIITISGAPGSGKTSVAKILAQEFGMPFYSIGDLRGKMAMEKGLTIDQLNELGENDQTTDTSVDEYQKQLGLTQDNFIIEGRLSWHFIPHSYKVFLDCEPREAARRILESKNYRVDETLPDSLDQAQEVIEKRIASDVRRYRDIYGLDYREPSHYDLFLDTSASPGPENTVGRIREALKTHIPAQTLST